MSDTKDRTGTGALLDRITAAIGTERVRRAPGAGPNTAMFAARQTHAVVSPRTADEVAEVVRLVGQEESEASLHLYSTGFNWGLGSRESADDGVIALDLAGLDRVRDMDIGAGWAVIEPGVTQGRLADRLVGTDRMLNVTSSSAHTSVLGNALDRGVAMRQQRTQDLLGLEAVLPDGQIIHTGWWPDTSPEPLYPHGLGPSLTELLTQSNLAVVTAAAVRLLPRPESMRLFEFNFDPEVLEGVVAQLHRWVSQGMTRAIPKLYDPFAARPYGGPEGQCLLHVCVDGASAAVDAIGDAIAAEARESGLYSGIVESRDQERSALFDLVERSYAGDPDIEDTIFERKMATGFDQVDTVAGFLLFLPLVPFRPAQVAEAARLLQSIRDDFGLRCGATLHPLDSDVIDYVVNVRFERDEEGAKRAHEALDALYERFAMADFMPYRLDIDHADWRDRFAPSQGAVELTRRIKDFLDPHRAISAGRYR